MSANPAPPPVPAPADGAPKTAVVNETPAEYLSAPQALAIEKLPKETKELIIGISALVRNQSGPDPETAKAIADSEMHQETCRLEGFKEQLDKADKRHGRDHEYRMERLRHDNRSGLLLNIACIVGIGVGLYLYVAKGDVTLGTNLMTGCFVALLGPKSLLQKNKE
jgi:hypothetical protein